MHARTHTHTRMYPYVSVYIRCQEQKRRMSDRIDLDKPLWNQDTFYGRLKYFAWVTNPSTCLTPTSKLFEARDLVNKYRLQQEPPHTTREQVLKAHRLVLSAFHPDSGELQNFIGRMSFQVPGGMLLIGCMISFYRTNSAVIFWQWANQSFNALVNYTNRNAGSDITQKKLAVAYVSSTTSALVAALGLKAILSQRTTGILQRFVPFIAVAAANIVNIPLMRQSEFLDGIIVYDENKNPVTTSKYAAVKGISQVVFSRIIMAAPSMLLLPVIFQHLEKYRWMQRFKILNAPLQVLASGALLLVMTPTACALFPQRCSIHTSKLSLLDKKNLEELKEKYGANNIPERVYFNKGL
ncbi:sideroflexin-2 isoform X1 [Octopus bimaculoides]|nr:sideroflexin-2 isoform X1 [Octopus bimaculoides]